MHSPDRQFAVAGRFSASTCDRCGLLFQNPRIASERLHLHYPPEYGPYLVEEYQLSRPTRWHLREHLGYRHLAEEPEPSPADRREGQLAARRWLIPDFQPGGTLLEVGCASGNRLELLRRLGWANCIGNEYSESAAQRVRDRGFMVHAGPVERALEHIPEASLDAIVAGFVIEHVTDPFTLTRRLAAKLKPGGQLVFNTININSPDFWFYRAHWYDLDLPRHMVFFRRQDLWDMLEPDFTVNSVEYQSALNDYLGSARYRRRDAVGGWKSWIDRLLLRLGPRLQPALNRIAGAGYGGRIFINARRRGDALPRSSSPGNPTPTPT